MKVCSSCKIKKPLDQFSWRNKTKNTKSCYCKICFKQKYDTNRDYSRFSQHYVKKKERVKNLRKKLLEYFTDHPCEICKEKDPVVLEFDHKDPELKSFMIGDALRYGKSWASVQKEIEKCRVLCANCHRRETSKQFNWWYNNI